MERQQGAPHAQHVNQVLLRDVVFLIDIALQRRKDVALVQQKLAAFPLQVKKRVVCNTVAIRCCRSLLGWNGEILEFLAEYNNGLLCQQGILGLRRTKVG